MTETTIAGPGLQLSNGDHVCVFCRGGERDELLVPFLTDGLSAGDRCLAVVDTSEPEELLGALDTGGGAAHRADQLTVLASRDVYLTDRGFDMDGMLDFYGAELRGVAEGRSGYDCIRTAGEMTWALRDIPGVEDLLAYEARVNQVMAANPEAAAISLCLYDVERFDAELIVGVLRTHPKAVIAGTVIDNPFYIRPEEFLRQRDNRPPHVTDELRRLRAQLSSLQSLLTLSKLMGDSGNQLRIAELVGTAVPSLARCQLVGVELAGAGWELVGPAGGSATALREVTGVLQRLGRHGGAVASPAMAPGWVWAYPMQSAAGHAGFLVVAAAAEPPAEERFVLQSLAQQTGVALINARLQADERAAAAAALEAKREADRANTAKSEFLSRMSHELRTPLNAILGFGQLLQLDDLAEEQAESVDHIVRAGQHLLGLINEVLDLARIESGHLALSPEAVGVFEVIKDTVDLIGPLAAERAVRIHAPSPPECAWTVQADRQRLKQVLLNLASNAVKYNHHGGSISLTCHAGDDGRVRIAVADTGPGIPADKLPRLFTQFDRLGAEHSEVQGTGIGLVLAKRLAEAMGGALAVASVEGQGTTFTLELSLAMEPT